jgi:hypothetical protein
MKSAKGARSLGGWKRGARKLDRAGTWCSFCGKGNTAVAKLIAGPGVFVCDSIDQVLQSRPAAEGFRSEPGAIVGDSAAGKSIGVRHLYLAHSAAV